eukprot:TRINITY_DN7062_c0_g1_i3.p1 TRINITY_DN7062_c0_g1~~TRINITY_DN7062_c0_g1_i3.p1  ORF type:complete len:387 (-),score=36.58 TRINITY_DN7062_c0_g1_i3:200-1360(-)
MTADIKTRLNGYLTDGFASRPITNIVDFSLSSGPSRVSVETVVRDARPHKLTLDINSFELVRQSTSLTTEDFYDPAKVKDIYYPEIAETIKKATGAAHVKMWHHQVRNAAKTSGATGSSAQVQGYASSVHSDSHPRHGPEIFTQVTDADPSCNIKSGRFLYINAWRNISEDPIQNDHLAVCDETSLVKPDDYVTRDLIGPGYALQQYCLDSRNSEQHRWYYFPKMQKDEVLLFKQWDSDTTLSGRVCFHTSFSDPNAPQGLPSRQSIETRAIAFFPDHTPNTIAWHSEKKAQMDEVLIAQTISTVLSGVDTLSAWPKSSLAWLHSEMSKDEGWKNILHGLVQYHLKDETEEVRTAVRNRVTEKGFKDRLLAGYSKLKTSDRGCRQS